MFKRPSIDTASARLYSLHTTSARLRCQSLLLSVETRGVVLFLFSKIYLQNNLASQQDFCTTCVENAAHPRYLFRGSTGQINGSSVFQGPLVLLRS